MIMIMMIIIIILKKDICMETGGEQTEREATRYARYNGAAGRRQMKRTNQENSIDESDLRRVNNSNSMRSQGERESGDREREWRKKSSFLFISKPTERRAGKIKIN